MFIDNLIPSIDLAGYIRKYTIVDVVFSASQPVPFKAYPPHPQDCLQFYPKDTETVTLNEGPVSYCGKRAVVMGQFTGVSNRHIGRDFLTLQVVFQPGALYRITGIPAKELNNTYLDGDLLLGNEINYVNEKLFHAACYTDMIQIVEQYLRKLIKASKKQPDPLDTIANQLLLNDEGKSLEWFAKEACLCHRQFNRKFKERIGVNPKLFTRIARFCSAYKLKNKFPANDWLTIALHCGYHDYQHLVKDYKDFTGFTPVEFFEIESNSPERYFGGIEV